MEKPRMLAFMGFFICVSVHWNARMTEMKRSGIEVILAFADNVRSFQNDKDYCELQDTERTPEFTRGVLFVSCNSLEDKR